jgi:FxsC-like protein
MGGAAEGAPRPPVIIPILWVPERYILRWLPKGVSDIQYKHADFGVKYYEHGVRTLSKLNRHRDAYQDFLNGLARALVQAAELYRLKPAAELPSIHTVPNAFEDPREETSSPPQLIEAPWADEETAGPRFVQFIFVAGSRDELSKVRKSINYYGRRGDEWQPYLPEVEDQIIFLTGDVVWREKLIPRIVDLDQHIERRLEEAENENNIVVIVVDTWTLQLEQYSDFMRKYDRREFVNCVVMVPWNQNDSEAEESREALKGVIYSTFERKAVNKHPYTFYEWVSSPDALKRDLSVALNKARARVIEKSKRRKKAERQGVFIGKPIVEGPGRTRDAG